MKDDSENIWKLVLFTSHIIDRKVLYILWRKQVVLNKLCKTLDDNGIRYHRVKSKNGREYVYIDHGAFGHPAGMKNGEDEFRPEFRISVHEHPKDYYVKICGEADCMSCNEILWTIKDWG